MVSIQKTANKTNKNKDLFSLECHDRNDILIPNKKKEYELRIKHST